MLVQIKSAVQGTPEIENTPDPLDPMIVNYFSLNPNDVESGDKTKIKELKKKTNVL